MARETVYLSREQVRRVDQVAIRDWSFPGLVLMENAGRGVADVICKLGIRGPVLIACSKGNNGGDGFVIARHLFLRGYRVEVLLCCDPTELAGDALANFEWLRLCEIPVCRLDMTPQDDVAARMAESDWLVDALLGTGALGAPREPLAAVIRQMNGANVRRLAIDLPSGFDCDSGTASEPTFRADHTCTFVAPKIGMSREDASVYLGEVHCLDIGLPPILIERAISGNSDTSRPAPDGCVAGDA